MNFERCSGGVTSAPKKRRFRYWLAVCSAHSAQATKFKHAGLHRFKSILQLFEKESSSENVTCFLLQAKDYQYHP